MILETCFITSKLEWQVNSELFLKAFHNVVGSFGIVFTLEYRNQQSAAACPIMCFIKFTAKNCTAFISRMNGDLRISGSSKFIICDMPLRLEFYFKQGNVRDNLQNFTKLPIQMSPELHLLLKSIECNVNNESVDWIHLLQFNEQQQANLKREPAFSIHKFLDQLRNYWLCKIYTYLHEQNAHNYQNYQNIN